LQISKSYELLAKSLDYRATRAKIISANIANIDTPYYKAKDIKFEDTLFSEAKKLYGDDTNELELAKTNPKHMDLEDDMTSRVSYYLRATHAQRNDANTVDLDIETTELSKNQMMYQAAMSALQKESKIFKSVLDASSKV